MSALSRSTSDDGERSPDSQAPTSTAREDRHRDNELEADELAMTSPEGRPADPSVRGRTTIVLVAIAIGVVVVAAALIARTGSPALAIGVGLAGLIIVLLANPVVWASVLRVREREEVHEQHTEDANEAGPEAPQTAHEGSREGPTGAPGS